MRWALIVLLCAGCSACTVGAQGPRTDGPLSPDEALKSFELEPGYRIELAAAEPLIRDPVAIAFDERGRLYVVETRGYPGPLGGSIRRHGEHRGPCLVRGAGAVPGS